MGLMEVENPKPPVEFPPSPPTSNISSIEDEHDLGSSLMLDIPLPPPSITPTKILDVDSKTPDRHVPRDPRLIRLTGAHPFNVEAPLSDLYDSGFLTPPELFYVRNHGAVPEVHDAECDEWELSVEGLVEKPFKITLKQLISEFEQVTVPITLVCAGNRRKEQNQFRKSQGFSWGAAGVSTSLWTGPTLNEVLKRAKPKRNGSFLCMEGADQLPNGMYGTSVRMSLVMNTERGIMLAHKQNGEPLTPDHGKPLRVVIPGLIGGRSVKWLKRLIVTDKPSENWYHQHDNKVLPTMVTPEMAKDPSWWQDERYAIHDLSVNSAIAYPAHEETLGLRGAAESYTIKGYAYSGGMRRVTRVEVSFDKGCSWHLSDISYPEDRYRETERDELYGGRLDMQYRDACYCWCFWSLKTRVGTIAAAEDIVVRAMDDSMSIQPRDTYWSVLGMMHNAWFRIAIRKEAKDVLRFEHPTQPALVPGGWMERVKKEGGNLLDSNWGEKVHGQVQKDVAKAAPVDEVKLVNDAVTRVVEFEELKGHENAENPWFIVNGEVFDGTGFLEDHPGGATSIITAAGLDATEEFMAIHSETAKAMMPAYHIGTLSKDARLALANAVTPHTPDSEDFLNPRAWKKSTLIKKKVVSWDTRLFTFRLDAETQKLGLPVGQHLLMKIRDEKTGEVIVRAYTPISHNEDRGTVGLLVKIYFDTEEAAGGKMTMAMERLQINHTVEFKGPLGKLEYLGNGQVSIAGENRQVGYFLMICGGSGITPIFQVLRAAMEDVEHPTKCVVLDGNRLEEDILCREELDFYAVQNPEKLKLVYTLTNPGDEWTGRKGRVDRDLIAAEKPSDKPLVLVCGPDAMEKAVHKILREQGFEDHDIVFF